MSENRLVGAIIAALELDASLDSQWQDEAVGRKDAVGRADMASVALQR